jgi:hypothetical protein
MVVKFVAVSLFVIVNLFKREYHLMGRETPSVLSNCVN